MSNAEIPHNSFSWRNVAIGGGGYVSDVYVHPRRPSLVFFATNVGGLFRWDAERGESIPVTEKFPLGQSNFYPINGFAFHPTELDTMYIAAGANADRWATTPGAIFRSTDRGDNWTRITPDNWPVKVGGMNYPWVTQRLVVDPNQANVLLYGSNADGLWRSADDGATWDRVRTIEGISDVPSTPFRDESLCGVIALAFDPGRAGRAYAGVYADGVYQSDDHGATWTRIPAGPARPFRLAVSGHGALWVTHAAGVSRYTGETWAAFTPGDRASAFSALAIDPKNPDAAIVATFWLTGPYSHDELYRTTDGGLTWTRQGWSVNHTQSWLPDSDVNLGIASLAFDPGDPKRVWLTGGASVYRTEDIDAQPATWTPLNRNLEETYIFDLAELPNGTLLSAIADVGGFLHDNGLEEFPTRRLIDADSGVPPLINTYGLAQTRSVTPEGDPRKIVRVATQFIGPAVAVMASEDGGHTWSAAGTWQIQPFSGVGDPTQVAIAPTDPDNFVVTFAGASARSTVDGGATWADARGLPDGITNPGAPFTIDAKPLAADGATNGAFYYYHAGVFYRAVDGGRTFSVASAALPVEPQTGFYALETVPGLAGQVWLNLGAFGLFVTRDGGTSWTRLAGVEKARLFAIGKAAPGATAPTLYLYGTVHGVADGIFRSIDDGKTWGNIQDPLVPIGDNPLVMRASQRTFGLVYVGTAGRGIYHGGPASALPGKAPTIPRGIRSK
ncbi:MAG: hypothetical protein ACRDIY_15680 [Chloroflexota bacterium]